MTGAPLTIRRSVEIAVRKRNVEPERVEQMVSKIVRELESLGESEITTDTIGLFVMVPKGRPGLGRTGFPTGPGIGLGWPTGVPCC